MAPAWRAISLPPANMINVGMLRMPNLAATSVSTSVLTFKSLTRGSSVCADSANIGAIILHGPHHSAQKSTMTGSVPRSWRSNSAADATSIGCPVNSGLWHLPQLGRAPCSSFSRGARFAAPQDGQMIVSMVVFCIPFTAHKSQFNSKRLAQSRLICRLPHHVED